MSSEPIDIVVTDKVDPGVQNKFLNIASAALNAANNVDKLQSALKKISGNNLTQLARAQTVLATNTLKSNLAYLKQEEALNRAINAENKAALSSAKLGSQQANAAGAMSKAQIAAEKLAQAQAKTSAEAAKAGAAQAALATQTQRLNTATAVGATSAQTAQQKLAAAQAQSAAAQTRLTTAQTAGQTATQRLAATTAQAAGAVTRAATAATQGVSAQQRLAAAIARTQAAQDRAAITALRLQAAQARAAAGTTGYSNSLLGLARNAAAAAAAAAGAGFSIGYLVSLGDAYTTLQNKLQNVSTSQAQVNELTGRLFQLANDTRAPVEETATAFTRFDRALKSLGKSQEDTLRLTETVNKALVVGGATATESASALLQLSQAFNAGKLQGDEFRSLAENMPVVLDAVAKATNTPINQVKKLATEGKITSAVLFKAFKLIEKQIDDTFAKTTPTVGQAMVLLKNNVLQAFGEFDKAVGFTSGLAKVILLLSKNVDILAIAAIAAGAALLVAFGPAALAAVIALGAAIAANPIGLMIVGIAAVIAALTVFSDKIDIVVRDGITLKDVFLGALSLIGDAFRSLGSTIKEYMGSVPSFIGDAFDAGNKYALQFIEQTGREIKGFVNFVIAAFIAVGKTIGIVFADLPGVVRYVAGTMVNLFADAIEKVVSVVVDGLRKISSLLENVAPGLAASLNGALDNVTLKLPRVEIGSEAKDTAAEIAKTFSDAFKRDYVSEVAGAVLDRAATVARNRTQNTKVAGSTLRGAGKDTTVVDPDKSAVKRALLLAKVNGELDKQIAAYGKLAQVRAVEQALDEIDIKLASSKLAKLTAPEREQLKTKLELVEVNKRITAQQDAIYENVVGPAKDYADKLKAINNLTNINAITEAKANEQRRAAAYAYEQEVNPLADVNRSIKDQTELLGFNSREREVQAQIQQLNNSLLPQGKKLTDDQTAALREQLTVLQRKNELQTAIDKINSETVDAQRAITTAQEATNIAFERGTISAESYLQRMVGLRVELANLNLSSGIGTFEDAVMSSIGRITEGFTTLSAGATNALGTMFQSFADGAANSIGRAIVYGESLGDALRDVARSALSELLSALIKVGIQWLIMQAFGLESATTTAAAVVAGEGAKTIAIAAGLASRAAAAVGAIATVTFASNAAAIAQAAAWAPAAALVSAATFGANSIPAGAGLLATAGIAEGIAALSAIGGFEQGGFTGYGGTSQIAGVVHGQEFVNNAESTRRNRPMLEAMNRGATFGAGGGIQIEVNNLGTPQTYQAEQISEGRIRLIARDVVLAEAPRAVAGDLNNPNSVTSKSLAKNTHTQRSRTS